MIELFLISAALAAFCAYLQWQKDRQVQVLLKEQAFERAAWALERRDLNNRIQVPEAAPFMDTGSDAPPPQHVPFEDDDAFHKAMEDAGLAGDAEPWP